MNQVIVDIGDLKVSGKIDEVLITYSLGSCIGLMLYDPVARVGGMVHSMLPLSKIDYVKAQKMPGMFADTGIVLLLQELFNMGAKRKNIVAKIAGAASILDEKKLFNIGDRNYEIAQKILQKNSIFIVSEDVKGTVSRTVSLYIADGKTVVRSSGKETFL
ncbi:MAG: chemotaxis protein CheD [Candidatus Margulisiibacteriota bacterium]|nr:MAG: chemotaxis protein CheD [Candidatus Margulisbacteria bacterium GWD2_39_127]OGI01575.1 MAG: chemotaxis protein CheD [Candidatus Margulisbacteria bacterium GWF2_38_17]OGI10017.1 MAG: chemotaxis protein CheD [Candidatus Margulisbacteria bacterium GWE2_39_32]PZM78272.1 MAG: chemotaxis protein CheD [Candidatus Margulisiibacteriota bacterium]HAR61840.1 chemotaxis protein CheD [Candidatus Margulisiibacteriota bacterium]